METLYDNDKQWSISWSKNSDNTYTLTSLHGKINGKMVEHSTIISSGKNIGRSNETTILQQTKLEAQSAWNKKVKQGYSTSLQKDKNTFVKPMLANTYTEETNLTFPVWVQPKLDGVRCLIYKNGKDIYFQSRKNTMYEPIEHMLPELTHLFESLPKNTVLDGELYTHGIGFDKIVSMVRRGTGAEKTKHPDLDTLHYTIYDLITEDSKMIYEDRLLLLQSTYSKYKFKTIQCIETHTVTTKPRIDHWLHTFEDKGYEGIMIRRNGVYKENRSKDLLKYKRFLDDEFEVVGHHESKTGIPVFECVTKDGASFSVLMKETMEMKQQMMENVEDYYGKMLTVRFQEWTKDKIPRFPVGIEFRDYE
jgi:DNA ligase-1